MKDLTLDQKFERFLEIYHEKSLITSIKESGFYTDSFFGYIDNPDNLKKKEQYTRVRDMKGELEVEKLDQIEFDVRAKTIDPATARVLSDNAKWKACKFYPKMYGDKQQVEMTGKVDINGTIKIEDARLSEVEEFLEDNVIKQKDNEESNRNNKDAIKE